MHLSHNALVAVMQLLEAARGAAERRSASLRLTAPPQGWAPPRLPGAVVEYVPLDLRGPGANFASVRNPHNVISRDVKVWCRRSALSSRGPGHTMVKVPSQCKSRHWRGILAGAHTGLSKTHRCITCDDPLLPCRAFVGRAPPSSRSGCSMQ